ncbi:unnamed protein product [Didymodactylos carnosus]|uniref:WWE domain-containing protein n=1 Tax=Didymodactylos carnosus TaxID=1234261 RepID=A0A814K4H2_9BILA|nr:unnamed protein product [Didymodactylos carnosus]CAF3816001.1 unnamed protein product [Didymodactylos carnosus]
MATAAPLRNFQWYWNSSTTANDDHWTAYAGIENGIIEEAFQTGKSEVEISSNYVINFRNLLQYNKFNARKQRTVKRDDL